MLQVLHVSLEYGAAAVGGLGSVVTNMVAAQNFYELNGQLVFDGSVITPYYRSLYRVYATLNLIANVEHVYDDCRVQSSIYMYQDGRVKHYMVVPSEKYKGLFELSSLSEIYQDVWYSELYQRVKYFCSAVAGYVDHVVGVYHPKPKILFLHDWATALVPRLLRVKYFNSDIRSVFIVHIGNIDRGSYRHDLLHGIGLKFSVGLHMLKAVGIGESDKIVAVSPSFLTDCIREKSEIEEVNTLSRLYVMYAFSSNKLVGILNGFNYIKYSHLGGLTSGGDNVYAQKIRVKYDLINQLQNSSYGWSINAELPLIFYIGRFSPEKGVDTFAQVIEQVKDRAIFCALGRGITESVYDLIMRHSRQTPNIFISNIEEDQAQYAAKMRACADFTFVPSHNEACGLVPMEGFANGAVCINSGVCGLKDSVKPLIFSGENYDNSSGNGFAYEEQDNGLYNHSLANTINQALVLWSVLTPNQKNKLQMRIMQEAKELDWLSPNGPLSKYATICAELSQKSDQAIHKSHTNTHV